MFGSDGNRVFCVFFLVFEKNIKILNSNKLNLFPFRLNVQKLVEYGTVVRRYRVLIKVWLNIVKSLSRSGF